MAKDVTGREKEVLENHRLLETVAESGEGATDEKDDEVDHEHDTTNLDIALFMLICMLVG